MRPRSTPRTPPQLASCLLPALIFSFAPFVAPLSGAPPPPTALELRDQGLAELENEHPDKAEAIYRQLVKLVPQDPLPQANLAIALLRQQRNDEARQTVDAALRLAPRRAELLAIRGEIQQWSNDLEGALASYEAAVALESNDPELLYAAYQVALAAASERGEVLATSWVRRLAELRPENLVVLLQMGQRAIKAGDRAGATAAFLRVGELLWQVSGPAQKAYDDLRAALEKGEVAAARVPALRLENVLKISPMFRESLRELKTGIQGIPLRRFGDESTTQGLGPPLAIRFTAQRLDARPLAGQALAVADFDGDARSDIAWVRGDQLELLAARRQFAAAQPFAAPGIVGLRPVDLDNDGLFDLLGQSRQRSQLWVASPAATEGAAPAEPARSWVAQAEAAGLASRGGRAAALIDFDIEGDLDLAVLDGEGRLELWRNNLTGSLEAVGAKVLPKLAAPGHGLVASDLDRDGDLDLVVGHEQGLAWLDNLRQGRFRDRTAEAGLRAAGAVKSLAVADLDQDGFPDLVVGGQGLSLWRGAAGGRFSPWAKTGLDAQSIPRDLAAIVVFDADNDGRLDLALAGPSSLVVVQQQVDGAFRPWTLQSWEAGQGASQLAAADLDDDGDLDLVAGGPAGLFRLLNEGGNKNRWLKVRLRGLDKGNSKNNVLGLGSALELRNGRALSFREAEGDVIHFGLGQADQAQVLRVVWTNGVPQNRLGVVGNQRVVEEQLLKGSCPFLYAWDGQRFRFVTDLLWGAPIGLPAAPGVWVPSDPSELVRIDGLAADAQGDYALRVTEELWEAAFFDHLRLWVVDHPAEVAVASNLRMGLGAPQPEQVLGARELRPVVAAWDGQGREVTAQVAERDEIYAAGYALSPYQGVAHPWSFTFDLGEAPEQKIRLWLEGWIFPADASLNLAVAQRADYPYLPPRLEVETAEGWQVLVPNLGFPAGKTKVMVVDLPTLPADARRLRLTTSFWLHWDRIQWTLLPDDTTAQVVARLEPKHAELRFRGFSALVRQAPNAPHHYDYSQTRRESPWLDFPGRYTRYGDVLPLLEEPDDLLAILAPGDEIDLLFSGAGLPPLPTGWQRSFFLESHGWDKDADRNTGEGEQLEPLPFRAMRSYPYAPGETYPQTPEHTRYRQEWLTREVPGKAEEGQP